MRDISDNLTNHWPVKIFTKKLLGSILLFGSGALFASIPESEDSSRAPSALVDSHRPVQLRNEGAKPSGAAISVPRGQDALKKNALKAAAPTFANVSYGDHPRQVLDFWRAAADHPTPLLFYIHGGGWTRNDKSEVARVEKYLAAGVSVVSINYRYSWQAQQAGVMPPIEWPLLDAARALQFVRCKAREWNIDPARIAASGKSAGAYSSLWLAFHPDMARPDGDPIARESTRLLTAAVSIAQTTLDPQLMQEWTPNSRYGGHAFGFMDPMDLKTRDTRFQEFLAHRSEVLKWIKEYSPMEHVSPDDPSVYLFYNSAPAIGQSQKDPTHTANFGLKLQEKMASHGIECELVYPGAPLIKHASIDDFLIEKLTIGTR